MKDQEYILREEKNKVLYDELTKKYNFYNSITTSDHNNTINPDAMWALDEIKKIRVYLLNGIEAKNNTVLTEQGVYIESNNLEDFNSKIKNLSELEAQIKDKIPGIEKRMEEAVVPEFNVEEELKKLDEVPVTDDDNYKEYQRQRQAFLSAINTSTYDKRKQLELKLMEQDLRWYGKQSNKLQVNKSRRESEKIQYNLARSAAKKRYENLSAFGKLLAKIKKQDDTHLDDFSAEQLDALYPSKKHSR